MMPSWCGEGAVAARCTGIGAPEEFGVGGCAGAAGVVVGNSADGSAEFGVGVGVIVDFGGVEAAAVAPGMASARCTLSVPFPETGAALPLLTGRLSGSGALGPTAGPLGVTGTMSCGCPTPPEATERCTTACPATPPPAP